MARILPLVREESQVLEVGCGAGLVAEQMARIAVRGFVSACDLSESAIAQACGRVKAGNAQFKVLDIGAGFEELRAWLPAPVDLVVMVDVLEHVPLVGHSQLFRNLATVVQGEGVVVLTFPSAGYQRYLLSERPEELQIIDEIIELPHLHDVAVTNGWVIKHFSLEDVWLPNQYVHCVLTRAAMDFSGADPNTVALREIASVVPPRGRFILVDQDEWPEKAPQGRVAVPFLEQQGVYWGCPADDASAIRECERLRDAGAGYLVVGWPAFWWLEHYAAFHQYLRHRGACLMENERIVIFQLQTHA